MAESSGMVPESDAYWVGALAMALARASRQIQIGEPGAALKELTDVLEHFSESPNFDEGLRKELAPYWRPREERGI